jgi:GT2 family glycosyltransferase
MRLLLGKETIVVKRKQIRPDVLRLHPTHPEALFSGFKAELQLRGGINEVKLQYKDGDKKWQDLGTWRLRLSKLWRLKHLWGRHQAKDGYAQWLEKYDTPSAAELDRFKKRAKELKGAPLVSVLLPISGARDNMQRTLDSVAAQTYFRWQLCIATDGSAAPEKVELAERASWGDKRIKIGLSEGHDPNALADALNLATGQISVFLREGDVLAPHALSMAVERFSTQPEVDLLYSDEDEIDGQGKFHAPRFKAGWNHELLLHFNCVGNLLAARTTTLRGIGGIRDLPATDREWDLLLRVALRIPRARIAHLPHVLYHQDQGRAEAAALDGNYEAAKKAVLKHLAEARTGATLKDTEEGGWRIVWPLPDPPPLVSIIIPTRNRADLLRVAMDSLFAKTTQPPFEIVIIDHASDEESSLAYFKRLSADHENVRILRVEGAFNWSRLNNLGAREARGDILLFLNNDVEITDADWLRELASNALRKDIGAVGACLLYPNGTIQHAGIVLGMTGLAGHVFRTAPPHVETLGGRPDLPREVTAVTGACLAVRRSVFEETSGFDEEHLPIGYNDVDFCLKLRAKGLRNLYTSFARLVHHESVSRGPMERHSDRKSGASAEARVVLARWPLEFQSDAHFSPNLSLDHEIPELGNPPPRLLAEGGHVAEVTEH